MNRIQVILSIDTDNLPTDFPEIVKHEQEILFKWKEEGILEHLYLTQTKDAAIMILKNVDDAKAKALTESLPLFKWKKNVQYFNLVQQF